MSGVAPLGIRLPSRARVVHHAEVGQLALRHDYVLTNPCREIAPHSRGFLHEARDAQPLARRVDRASWDEPLEWHEVIALARDGCVDRFDHPLRLAKVMGAMKDRAAEGGGVATVDTPAFVQVKQPVGLELHQHAPERGGEGASGLVGRASWKAPRKITVHVRGNEPRPCLESWLVCPGYHEKGTPHDPTIADRVRRFDARRLVAMHPADDHDGRARNARRADVASSLPGSVLEEGP